MPALATWVGKTMPWRRERAVRSESLRNPAILAIGGLAVLGGALLYFVFESSLQQRSRDQAIQYTEQVIGDLRALQTRVTDSETGQRGYLLTGDARYLAPYDAAPTAIDGLLRRLRSAFSGQFGDSVELVRLDQVGRLIASKLDDLNRSVVLQRSGNATDALADGLRLVQSDGIVYVRRKALL
jgi:CHASE3 domain sensor protein